MAGPLAGIGGDVWVAATPSLNTTNELCTDAGDHINYAASVHKSWDFQQPITVQVANDEFQTITITGLPAGGTFTLTFGGQTASGLAIASTAAQIQTALQALSSIGAGNVLVTGAAGGPWTVEFTGTLGNAAQATITTTNTFTGGTSPGVSIVKLTAGQAWATTTAYTFQYAGGVVVMNAANPATTHVRISSGYYFNMTQLDLSHSWSLSLKASTKDVTCFQATGNWGLKAATIKEGSGKIDTYRTDGRIFAELGNVVGMQLYIDKTNNVRWDILGLVTGIDPKSDAKDIEEQTMSFDLTGGAYLRST